MVTDDTPTAETTAATSLAELTDEGVMLEVTRGRREALAELYDRHAARVNGLAGSVLRGSAQSEEITRDVFVEAWREARSYHLDTGPVGAWLLHLAHGRAVAHVSDDDLGEAASIHDVAFPSMDGLTDLQREVILLAWFIGHTHRTAAALLGVTPATVAEALTDGLRLLRTAQG